VARDRQRAKQRQAERRARRQAGGGTPPRPARSAEPDVPEVEDPRVSNPIPGITPDLAVGAPPPEEGRSDYTLREEQLEDQADDDLDDVDPELEADALEAGALEEIEDRELGLDGDGHSADYAPRGRRGAETGAGHARDRSRVVQFLVASWAELQRVQWPDRQALTTLTGVVLGFVLIMGGYLGLLDAVFSRIINAIL
jgi:preprotein translocase subunit SecE